jgi:hypothetical protein
MEYCPVEQLILPPMTADCEPEAILLRPPETKEVFEVAQLTHPPPTKVPEPHEIFCEPPTNEEYIPLAVLRNPPRTEAQSAPAVLPIPKPTPE